MATAQNNYSKIIQDFISHITFKLFIDKDFFHYILIKCNSCKCIIQCVSLPIFPFTTLGLNPDIIGHACHNLALIAVIAK